MKLVLKIILCLVINGLILKALFINSVDKYSGKSILIKQVYSKPGYKYWTNVDGKQYCKITTPEERNDLLQNLGSYSNSKANVVYFLNVDVIDCLDFIKDIALDFHSHGLEIAFNLETNFDRDKAFNSDFTALNDSYYKDKFLKAESVNDWLDYIVFDNSMQYLTFEERRRIQVVLRETFRKPYIGFRFTKDDNSNPESTHPVRTDKSMKEFLPRDDEGDFIITQIATAKLKRTMVFIENSSLDSFGADGEFIR